MNEFQVDTLVRKTNEETSSCLKTYVWFLRSDHRQLQRLCLAGLGKAAVCTAALVHGPCMAVEGGAVTHLRPFAGHRFACVHSSLGGTCIPLSEARAVVLFKCPSLLRPPSRRSASRGGNHEDTASVPRIFPLRALPHPFLPTWGALKLSFLQGLPQEQDNPHIYNWLIGPWLVCLSPRGNGTGPVIIFTSFRLLLISLVSDLWFKSFIFALLL